MKHADAADAMCRILSHQSLWPGYWNGEAVAAALRNLTREHRFHPTRKWRFDVAFPALRVAIEVQGGTWITGRHSRGKGYQNDCDKHNAAVELGWLVLTYTAEDLKKKPHHVVQQIANCLDQQRVRQVVPDVPRPAKRTDDQPPGKAGGVTKRIIKAIRG